MTHSHAEIRALLHLHGLTPSRALGQNFVGDAHTVRRIALLAYGAAGHPAFELVPGLGRCPPALSAPARASPASPPSPGDRNRGKRGLTRRTRTESQGPAISLHVLKHQVRR